MAIAGGIAAAAAQSFANAIKASGAIIEVTPAVFQTVLSKIENPLIVCAKGGFFSNHQYMVSYKGFVFVTKSSELVSLPPAAEIILAEKIWIPR